MAKPDIQISRKLLWGGIAGVAAAGVLAGALVTAYTGAGGAGSEAVNVRPYDPTAPWNTPIPDGLPADASSDTFIQAIADNGLPLTSDPTQYTIPVWMLDGTTPMKTVKGSGYFSTYDSGDHSRVGHGSPWTAQFPIPKNAKPGAGSDGQMILWDAVAGTEYGFWQFSGPDRKGVYHCSNAYRYHTTEGYMGRFADGLAGRGDGTPYLAGLVRKWEVDQGHIDHALAFAYNSPSAAFVYPASKSDGGRFGGVTGVDLPEGSRIQLDPALTDLELAAYGLNPSAITIAHALQTYGAYVVDHSGSSKVYLEYQASAGWDTAQVNRLMLAGLPWGKFRVVDSF